MAEAEDVLTLGNDFEFEWNITRKNTDTRVVEAATGLAPTAYLAASPTGGTIHATLSKPLTEAASKPGSYYGTVDAPDLDTHLEAYVDRDVYEVVVISGDLGRRFRRWRVRRSSPAD